MCHHPAVSQKATMPNPTGPQTAGPANAPAILRSVASVRMATTVVMTSAKQPNRSTCRVAVAGQTPRQELEAIHFRATGKASPHVFDSGLWVSTCFLSIQRRERFSGFLRQTGSSSTTVPLPETSRRWRSLRPTRPIWRNCMCRPFRRLLQENSPTAPRK
jgi:hypothetical protein